MRRHVIVAFLAGAALTFGVMVLIGASILMTISMLTLASAKHPRRQLIR